MFCCLCLWLFFFVTLNFVLFCLSCPLPLRLEHWPSQELTESATTSQKLGKSETTSQKLHSNRRIYGDGDGVGWGGDCSRSCTCSVHIKLLQPQNLWGWNGVGWGCSRSCTCSIQIKLLQPQNLWGWDGVGWWGCSRSCTCSVHIKLLQLQNLWGWDGVGWGGDVHVRVHVAFTSSCCKPQNLWGWDGEGCVVGWGCSRSCTCSIHIKLLQPQNLWGWDGVGWGGDVHVHVHVAFTSSCCNRRIYGDGMGWGGVGMFTFVYM